MTIVWLILIISFASLLKGITGFGFALVSLPLLMFWYPAKELIPILFVCNLISSFIIILQKKDRKLVDDNFKNLIIYAAVFTILGVMALNYVSESNLVIVLSSFLIVLSLLSLLGVKYKINLTRKTFKITGSILGFLTGFISISGPPLALFLNASNTNNQEFREIFSWFSVITASIALIGYGFLGLLNVNTFKMALMVLPILFAGSYIGKRLNNKIPLGVFRKVTIFISLIASVIILIK